MNETRLNPLNDFLFMKYMGQEGDEEQLLAFLNVVLHDTDNNELASVKILETKLSTDIPDSKITGMMGIRAKRNDGSKVYIEVQLCTTGNMDKRSLYYWCLAYEKSMQYDNNRINPSCVITININDEEELSTKKVHTCFHFREDNNTNFILTDIMEMHFIDMVKFRSLKEKDIEHNRLHRWLTFFDKNADCETIQKVIEMDASIGKANKKFMSIVQDSET